MIKPQNIKNNPFPARMKILPNKPIIINLREHISQNERKKFRRNQNFLPQDAPGISRLFQKQQQNRLFTSPIALDDEMKNDFKWLINFNLKDILPEALNDDTNGRSKRENLKMNEIASKFSSEKGNSRNRLCSENLSDDAMFMETIIERCLQEKKSLSIKSIYKWIREQNPSLKKTDRSWKNKVKMALFGSPLFRIKKSPRGKCGVWYLDKSTTDDPKLSPITCKQKTFKSSTETLHNGKFLLNSLVCSPAKEYFQIYGTSNDCSKGMISVYAQNWLETGFEGKDSIRLVKLEEPMESFEIEIPIANELLESEKYGSIEIPFLNDDACSIFI